MKYTKNAGNPEPDGSVYNARKKNIDFAPLAFYFMYGRLENCSFRITPGAGIFLITLGASVVVGWPTAGY